MRPRSVARARRRRHNAGQRGGFGSACAVRGHPAQPLMPRKGPAKEDAGRLAAVSLDEASLGSSNDDVEHERRVAIYDLIENNKFQPSDHDGGPYALRLGISGNRLAFDIRLNDGTPVIVHI